MIGTDTMQAIVDRLVARFDPERIILFGSYARGDADDGSDVDLLIVADTDLPPRDRYTAARQALGDFPAAFDVFLRTPRSTSVAVTW